MGTPYAQSSDLVSAWPAKSLAVATYVDAYKTDLAMVQNPQTGTTYTLVALDTTKLVTLSNAAAVAVTLPLESSVPWASYTQLRLMNLGAGTVTLAGAVGVTINGTPLTLAQWKSGLLVKTATNTWTFTPLSSGSAGAVVSSTTGSPTITSYTSSGITYDVYKYTANGTLVIGATGAGVANVLVVGGGASGGNGGPNGYGAGGGAGGIASASVYLPVGTISITVGAAGAALGSGVTTAGNSGGDSKFNGYLIGNGGGGGGSGGQAGVRGGGNGAGGGCGGGGGSSDTIGAGAAGAASLAGWFGFNGSAGVMSGGGGVPGNGGGAGGAASGSTGGIGKSSSITGTAVTYSVGGGGGAANTGNSGGLAAPVNPYGGSNVGKTGVVIVSVAR
jgi:hypothetical protein